MIFRHGTTKWNLPDTLLFSQENGKPQRLRLPYTVEYREPKKGEHFLSGAVIEAHLAHADMSNKYLVATPKVSL